MHANAALCMIEVVLDGGSIPAPSAVSRAQTQEPVGALLALMHHVGQVLHYAPQVSVVDV